VGALHSLDLGSKLTVTVGNNQRFGFRAFLCDLFGLDDGLAIYIYRHGVHELVNIFLAR